MKRLIALGAALMVAGFAWGLGTARYHLFPYDLIVSASDYRDPRLEARREYFAQKSGPAQTVFVGDSIVQWVEWGEEFPGALNRGIGSNTTSDVLDRIDSLARLQADTYVILIGMNDIEKERPVEKIAANVERIVAALPGRKIVMAVPPCSTAYADCNRAAIDSLNARLATLDGITFVPTNLDAGTDLADKVHPNARGIAKLVEAIRPHVDCAETTPS